MKIRITLKDPDGVWDSVADAAKESVATTIGLSNDERLSLLETRRASINKALLPWIKYGEYVTIEIDTDAKTATVIPVLE